MSASSEPSFAKRLLSGFQRIFLVLFFVLLIWSLLGGNIYFIFQIPFHFVCGWVLHAWKALPPFFEKWQAAALPVGCLLMAFVIAHRFIRRWVEEKRPALGWRIQQTAAVFSLILLGSAAAIAMSGIVHQFFWLAGGKVIERNRKFHLTMATSNGRQLMLGLLEFYEEKGRYPRSFDELESEDIIHSEPLQRLMWLDLRDENVPEPWVLLRPGCSKVAANEEPVIVSPVIPGDGMVVVGYSDFTVRSIRVENLERVLSESRMNKSEVGR
jgi:hypothetical protein